MSSSRRDFLLRTFGVAGAAAAAGAVPGCAFRVDPAPVADVPEPVNGKLTLELSSYPELAQPGGSLMARAKGLDKPVLVTRLSDTSFTALAALCPHAGCPLGYVPASQQVECPCHGSRFDPVNGKVLNPPAKQGLAVYYASYDASAGRLTVDLISGDPDFPPAVDGKVVLPLSSYPALAQAGGVVKGTPRGLGKPLLVVALDGGGYSAVDSTCTHLACLVDYVKAQGDLECPCHGSTFSVSGEVTSGPATLPLTKYTAARTGDSVTVQVG